MKLRYPLIATLAAAALNAQAAVPFADTGMVNVRQYGAIPNDGVDDAAAIKNAVADVVNPNSVNYSKTIYFESGQYDLFSKIVLKEQTRSCGSHTGQGTVVLVGETNGPRPVLRLKNNKYPSGSNIVVDIQGNTPACAFRNGFRGIDIDLGSGNGGAIGLKFDAAQDSFLEDVKVTATGANKGIIAVPGRSMAATNIEVVGGRYGMELVGGSLGATLVGVKLTGQTTAPLTANFYSGVSVTGLQITTSATKAITVTGGSGSGFPGHLSLYDASVTFTGSASTRTVVSNANNRAISLVNVHTVNAKAIVDHGSGPDLFQRSTAVGATEHVLNYVRAPRGISGITGIYRVDGVQTNASDANDPPAQWGVATEPIPADLVSRHVWSSTPSFSDAGAVNAIPPGFDQATQDAYVPIQAAIDAALPGQVVFVPAGTWRMSAPLTLHATTRLIGVAGLRTNLKPVGWSNASASFMVETDDDPDASTLIQDIAFDTPNGAGDRIGGIHWRAGRDSIVRRVRALLSPAHRETDKVDYLIDGSGGGRWYSLADHTNIPDGSAAAVPVDCNYRKVLVSGTTQPLSFYGLDLERGGTKKQRAQYPMGEIRDARNMRVFGQKMEIDGAEAESSDLGCNTTRTTQPNDKGLAWDIHGASDNLFFAMVFSNDVTTEAPMLRVASGVTRIAIHGLYIEDSNARVLVRDEGAPTPTIDRKKWVGQYKRGTVDHSVFDHLP